MGINNDQGIPTNSSQSTSGNFFSNTWDKLKDWYTELFVDTPIQSKLFDTNEYWEEYFCGSDIGIYIGDTWVDDVVTIQYTMTNNKSPIYGYMSENFDAVSKGTRIVQGQFTIAFREVGYLSNILDNYTKKMTVSEKTHLSLNTYEEDVSLGLYTPVDKFSYADTKYGGYVNRAGFDIFVTFGDVTEKIRGGTIEVINNCHITSRSIVCEPSGEPIAEIYSFFARGLNEYQPKYSYGFGEHDMESVNLHSKNYEDPNDTLQKIQRQADGLLIDPSKLDLRWREAGSVLPSVGLEETKTSAQLRDITPKLTSLNIKG